MRIQLENQTPDSYAALSVLAEAVRHDTVRAGLEPRLLDLVRVRASQINGCGFCLDLHTRDALANGETQQRLHTLAAWRETGLFSDRERAALELAEAVTLVHDGHVPDRVYFRVSEHFRDAELAALVWVVVLVNAHNRVAIATRVTPVPTG